MTSTTGIVWFRRDLRLADNPALCEALKECSSIVLLYIWSPMEEEPWTLGEASRWWLHSSLLSLSNDIHNCGSRLVIRQGKSLQVLTELAKEVGAKAIYWNRLYEPNIVARDTEIKASLRQRGFDVKSFKGSLYLEPWEYKNSSGKPFQVFTPFWKGLVKSYQHHLPLAAPKNIKSFSIELHSLSIASLSLLPNIAWDKGLWANWKAGEGEAHRRLEQFLTEAVVYYDQSRNIPGQTGTSRLSPHLHFGEITPRQVWEATSKCLGVGAEIFLKELGWREFAHHLLFHFPQTPTQPLREQFRRFPWKRKKKLLRAWQQGVTGYPIVDAGMRELWSTGWMHNRVRMIVASFLVKHLLQPWQDGSRWFWDTLVDADLANNTLGWQWTAGCGADAAPYFRIFNPVLQGEKFDPTGEYVKHFIPELQKLPVKWIHRPWEAPAELLQKVGIVIGKDYPRPIIDLYEARDRALEAYQEIKGQK